MTQCLSYKSNFNQYICLLGEQTRDYFFEKAALKKTKLRAVSANLHDKQSLKPESVTANMACSLS